MISLRYLGLPTQPVKDKNDFFKSGVTGVSAVRGLCSTARRLFVVPDSCIFLSVVGDGDGFMIEVVTADVNKRLLGKIYYLPGEKRLDVYDAADTGIPLVAWQNKKVAYRNFSELLQKVNMENLFLPLLNVT
jgi:hypothetical protein